MEGGDQNVGGGSRWNPTKEQISMLENLYKQGLRTPTAEQIQQITIRLQDFGHIEGKNVFYWFQNHKARQRQKQKQESFAYYNRFLHHATPPVFSPYHHNVTCNPCYMPRPKNDPGLYPKVQLPAASGSFKRSRMIPESTNKQQSTNGQRYNISSYMNSHNHRETLDLFPIHPTGVLQSRNEKNKKPISSCCTNKSSTPSSSTSSDNSSSINEQDHPFFDFFCGN